LNHINGLGPSESLIDLFCTSGQQSLFY